MKIALAAGGTGGHIYPAVAVAQVFLERGDDCVLLTRTNGLKDSVLENTGVPIHAIDAFAFNRSRPWSIVTAALKNNKSKAKIVDFFKEYQPDVVIAFGGYVSLPVCGAARELGIPYMIHEQNSVPGLANKTLASHAAVVALTYSSAQNGFAKGSNFVMTGNPIRDGIRNASAEFGRSSLSIPTDATLLFVFGGSLGALSINKAFIARKDELLAIPNLHVVQVSGSRDYEYVLEELALSEEESCRWHVISYCENMGDMIAASDLICCRAGATSISEIAYVGRPSVLIPYPYAANDEQSKNAADLVKAGGAVLVKDNELDTQAFTDVLVNLLESKESRASMAQAAKACAFPDSAQRIAELACSICTN